MRRRDLLSTFGVAAGAITFASVRGQAADMPGANAAQAPSNPHPPYLVSVTEQLGIVFEADESALKSLLPPNVKPAAGNTVGLNMYRAQVLGLVPYAASYLWINVDGFDSPDGTKGRWMSQGWYGPEPVTTVFKTQFGYPVELGATRVEREGNRIHAVLNSGGADLINAAIALKEANPNAVGGVLHYPALRRNLSGGAAQTAMSDIIVNRLPFTGEVIPASPVSLEFHFSDTDAAKVLQPKRLLDAFNFKGTAFLGAPDVSPREVAALR